MSVDKFLVMDTQLGHIIGGVTPASDQPRHLTICNITLSPVNPGCELYKFWELEEVPTKPTALTMDEQKAVDHLQDSSLGIRWQIYILYLSPGDCLQCDTWSVIRPNYTSLNL